MAIIHILSKFECVKKLVVQECSLTLDISPKFYDVKKERSCREVSAKFLFQNRDHKLEYSRLHLTNKIL